MVMRKMVEENAGVSEKGMNEEQTEQTEQEQTEEEQTEEEQGGESEGGESEEEIIEKLKKIHARLMNLIQELTEMYAFRREAMLAGDYEAERAVIKRIKRRRRQFLNLARKEEELAEQLESMRGSGE